MSSEDLFVTCACGSRTQVSASMAGSTIRCRCGRASEVPSLGELRRQSGKEAYVTNAVEAVRKALGDGTLPGSECVSCRASTDRILRCRVVCERSLKKKRTFETEGDLLAAFARLLSPIWMSRSTVVTETHGRDTVVELSFCLCKFCRATSGNLRRRRVLRRLLELVPQYKELLEEYPGAEIEPASEMS